jgi:hypothetical protein
LLYVGRRPQPVPSRPHLSSAGRARWKAPRSSTPSADSCCGPHPQPLPTERLDGHSAWLIVSLGSVRPPSQQLLCPVESSRPSNLEFPVAHLRHTRVRNAVPPGQPVSTNHARHGRSRAFYAGFSRTQNPSVVGSDPRSPCQQYSSEVQQRGRSLTIRSHS